MGKFVDKIPNFDSWRSIPTFFPINVIFGTRSGQSAPQCQSLCSSVQCEIPIYGPLSKRSIGNRHS